MDERTPTGLGAAGRKLWTAIVSVHNLDPMQLVQLEEACRAKDRLDKLDSILRGDADMWCQLILDVNTERTFDVRVTAVLAQANATANLFKQLLAALRLPDAAGKRPQARGGARGAYVAGGPGDGKVSSLERARARKSS
jgi:hypothetical protein